jgi:hypothetical protein
VKGQGLTERYYPGELVERRVNGERRALGRVVIEGPDRRGQACVLVRGLEGGELLGWLASEVTRVKEEATIR